MIRTHIQRAGRFAAACAALTAAALLVGSAAASEAHPTLPELEGELICPTCETTLDQSNAPVAERMRVFIRQRIAAGDTKSEIKDRLVDQFGAAILAAPPRSGFDLLAWLLPLAGLAAGVLAVSLVAWRWSRARAPARPSTLAAGGAAGLEPALERRLDDELARFDG